MPRTTNHFTEKQMKEIGARIKQARLEAGISQKTLAKRVDKSIATVAAAEQGKTMPFSWVRQLSQELKRTESWFWHGDEAVTLSVDDKLDQVLAGQERILSELGELRALLGSRQS